MTIHDQQTEEETEAMLAKWLRQRAAVLEQRDALLDLLVAALPCVEESEQFNKPAGRDLSKRIRAALVEGNLNGRGQ